MSDTRATGLPELKLYNTLTRTKESFTPLDPALVRMYVCGPTVYDFAHIGNARPVIVFDLLYRMLRHVYGADHVKYVRNITDVDDKINARAASEHPGLDLNEAIAKVTFATEAQFHDDLEAIGVLHPDVEPRATEHIAEMRALIERLVASGNAYVAEDHVLFSVPSMPDYGQLSHRPLDEMLAGARVDVAPYKRDAMDFVLWKPSKRGEPGWPSPSGITVNGRPGWHIECSAMSWKHLGETFDIHGGGIDLVFPHHENEVAQSRCAFHANIMAKVWMHNGFLQVEGEKMSKSAGNFITIRQLLADWPGDVLRLNMLRTHYRQPIDWTLKGLEESAKTLEQWFDAAAPDAYPRPAATVLEALADDLNTPKAIAEMHALKDHAGKKALGGTLAFLGFSDGPLRAWAAERAPTLEIAPEDVEARLAERIEARRNRDWATSDRIRDELLAQGVALKDNKDGTTTWEPKR
ncbi:cysteine--tRNA ligase [Ancylobacter pratisalsi]|uniref:Cysteine--tRNA ligase n=1 Tax=Ancylobacter pratisalsi TaxID=1745854 RepID=A0A6P1YIA2_9HYPH|nr:cysteine--tRNA ligase [Ancylobacter pratisalsi]QIB33009.1 cysteine--tRNA ligase [Ancylobacter pratisalsi]